MDTLPLGESPAKPCITPAAVRAEMVRRIDASADRTHLSDSCPVGAPYSITAVGVLLASLGFTDEESEGERFFQSGFAFYRELASSVPEIVADARKVLFRGRRAWFPGAECVA